jgi:hypothetical protein
MRGHPVSLFLFGWSLLLLCPKLQALLPPSPFAVQFLFPFDLVLAHSTSLIFHKLIKVIVPFPKMD